jgi:hypothetical protein
MRVSRYVFYGCLISNAFVLSISHFLSQSFIWISVIVIMTFAWWFARRKELNGLSNICFVFFTYISMKCVFMNDSIILPMIAMIVSLFCWDVEYFDRRLSQVPQVINRKRIEKTYLFRLVVIGILSLIISSIAANLTIHLSFMWILALSLLIMLILGQISRLSVRKNF